MKNILALNRIRFPIIRMKGVKSFYNEVRERVESLMTLRRQPYGCWEFEVKDLNGYTLVFSESIGPD